MGLVEHGMQDLNANLGNSGISENLVQNSNSGALTPGNCKLDSKEVVIETVERKEVREVENIDTKLVSMQQSSHLDAKGVTALENVKTPVFENSEGPMFSQLTDLEDMDLPPGFSFPKPDNNGKLEPAPKDVTDNPGHLEDANKGTPDQARKRKTKLKSPVTSSWALRTKSQEKPNAPVLNETVKEGSANGEKKRRGRKKKQTKENTVDDFSRTKTHLRYLLHRIKYEQNLIDAYSAEGWKGQSLEKLKPEKELERAKSHISRYKLRIRALFQQLDSSLAVGKLPALLFDCKGEIDSEDIFCAKCGSKDLTLDNDIILCDGACERGFHQFCLDPPLLREHIPQGDEAWLCPGCDCKVSCIDMLKDFHGTNISITDSWEKIFPEAAAAASGKKLEDNSISSSDDSEDDDYDPDKPDTVERVDGDKSCSDESNYVSASEDAPEFANNNSVLLPPDDSDEEDDDFDPTAADSDEQAKKDSSSSDFSSDSEDLDGLLGDSAAPGKDPGQISPLPDEMQGKSIKNELSYLMEASGEPVSGKRHVERLDYKKLHEETYGDYSSDSSDEDFGAKRRKVNREKSKVKSTNKTPSTNRELDTKDESTLLKDSSATVGSASADTKSRSAESWIGGDAKKRLYEYFDQNQYPEKAAREKMANELGLTIIQVTRWFGHARWTFNHKSKPEPNTIEKPPEPGPANGTGQVPEMQESVENSGKRKYRKRKPRKDQTGDNVTVTQNTQEQNPLI